MSVVTSEELHAAQSAIGRSETRVQLLDAESLTRFGLAIGCGAGRHAPPVLGHWSWFVPHHEDRELGADGHPERGGFLPHFSALPRRMFAASGIRFLAPLSTGEHAEALTRIIDVRHKAGRSGDLVFVEVERKVLQDGEPRLVENQTIVYREEGAAVALPDPAIDAEEMPEGGELWHPGKVNLFRFSAVTFNAHRIHYDQTYAADVERYPALIVHGPFIAARLAELAARRGPLAGFQFRAQAPCFVDQPIRLAPHGADEFHAIRCDGTVATIAKALYR